MSKGSEITLNTFPSHPPPILHHHIKRLLLVALGLHHIELEAYTLNDTKVSRPPSLPYVSEEDQQVQSAQFKASVLI